MSTQSTHMTHGMIALALTLLLAVAIGLGRGTAYAADGDLDTAFDGDGRVTTDFAGTGDEAYGITIQADGKIVAVGGARGAGGSFDFAVARYNSNGTLDPAFGGVGKVTTDFASDIDGARALAIQPDGKIVAAGFATIGATSQDLAVARYNSNGTLDTTFDSDGRVSISFSGGSFDMAFGVAIQPDGKIVLAGNTGTINSSNFALARLNPNGTLDATFDTDGKVTITFGGGNTRADAVAIQSDGKIVAAGEAMVGTSRNFALARFNPNGTLDTGFNGNGTVIVAFSTGVDAALALAIQPDGKIVAAGHAFMGEAEQDNFALARFNPNGSLDLNLDGDGMVTTDFGGNSDVANGLALQSDGKIVLAGFRVGPTAGTDHFALARYNPNGGLDGTFGAGGKGTTDFAGNTDRANDVAIQPDGKIVAAGFAFMGGSTDFDFALARYLSDGPTTPTPTPTGTPTGTPYPLFGDTLNSGDGYTEFSTTFGDELGAWSFYSESPDPNASALLGAATLSGSGTGVSGLGRLRGVYGLALEGAGNGVVGESSGAGKSGVFGMNTGNNGYGVRGTTSGSAGAGVAGSSTSGPGVLGSSLFGSGVVGSSVGGVGVYGFGSFPNNRAGYFSGNVLVTGNLSKGGGSFKIDHPLDPENMYLYHSFVESPDMKNIYDGVAILDSKGEALVTMPDWFSPLNTDFRYQLTTIGTYAPVYIAQEITRNAFKIAGGRAGTKVSWQVTGIRQDPYANVHRIPVEEAKPAYERGTYLHPTEWGKHESLAVDYEERQRIEQLAEDQTKP